MCRGCRVLLPLNFGRQSLSQTEGRSAVSVMETPATVHNVRARASHSASGLLHDDRPLAPEPARQVDQVGELENHPSFRRRVPLNDPLTRADSGVAMRRRHGHITCSTCGVTYLGLAAPQESAQTAAWVCARCAGDTPDGTGLNQETPEATGGTAT